MRRSLLTVAFLIGLVAVPVHAQQGPTQADMYPIVGIDASVRTKVP